MLKNFDQKSQFIVEIELAGRSQGNQKRRLFGYAEKKALGLEKR